MALAARDTFKPDSMLNGKPFPLWQVTKESATTWVKGAVIIATSGFAVEAADGPTTGTILGIAAEAAVADTTTALIVPALPEVVFSGCIATGDTGGDYTSLVTNRYLRYGVSLDSSTAWYINAADTTDLAVMVTEFIDDIGDNLARVKFVFVDSKFNAI